MRAGARDAALGQACLVKIKNAGNNASKVVYLMQLCPVGRPPGGHDGA